ncbi:MAG: hypothetical protein KDD28_27050 [Phaeodactylibacter sp.]|nr:hypothetical protein [Phaeodactylibacter sp.]
MQSPADIAYYTYQDILEYMATGQPFSLQYVTFDRRRKKGGALKYISEAILVQAEKEAKKVERKTHRPLTLQEVERLTAISRKPNHGYWFTRNIRIVEHGHPTSLIRKVHIILITEFNGQPVTP